jgi:lysophospholipase L1-like esterase
MKEVSLTNAQYRTVTATRESLTAFCEKEGFKGWPHFTPHWEKDGKAAAVKGKVTSQVARDLDKDGFTKVWIASGLPA